MAPSGRLLIVDFAPHDLEFLREAHQFFRVSARHTGFELNIPPFNKAVLQHSSLELLDRTFARNMPQH